jgi:hypothetical protein
LTGAIIRVEIQTLTVAAIHCGAQNWEIHPVYSIDVCSKTTLAACGVNDESKWTPFEQWIVVL